MTYITDVRLSMTIQGEAQAHSALEHLVERLGSSTESFTPSRADAVASPDLPGRQAGTNLAMTPPRVSGAEAVIMDCGTSRREGFTHVLWISGSAESILGSYGFSRLGEAIGSVPRVTAYDWEGLDRLHLRAGGMDWDELIAQTRAAIEPLLLQH